MDKIIKAVKQDGLFLKPSKRKQDCDFYCIFRGDFGIVTVPVIDKGNHFIIPTIWEAIERHRNIYIRKGRENMK